MKALAWKTAGSAPRGGAAAVARRSAVRTSLPEAGGARRAASYSPVEHVAVWLLACLARLVAILASPSAGLALAVLWCGTCAAAPATRPDERCPGGVDLVYTWVDGADPRHRASLQAALKHKDAAGAHRATAVGHAQAQRFRDFGGAASTLRFSLRSQQRFAPWIRHVWIVTADAETQRPSWLTRDRSVPITVVPHAAIFPDWARQAGALPTFNSCAIEMHLHRIKGLAECYLYLNDDVVFLKPLSLDDFWEPGAAHPFAFTNYQIAPFSPKNQPTWSIKLFHVGREIRRITRQPREDVLLVGHHGHFFQRSVAHQVVDVAFNRSCRATTLTRWRSAESFWLPFAYSNYAHAELGAPRKRVHALYFGLTDEEGAAAVQQAVDRIASEAPRLKFAWACFNDLLGEWAPEEVVAALQAGLLELFPARSKFETDDPEVEVAACLAPADGPAAAFPAGQG